LLSEFAAATSAVVYFFSPEPLFVGAGVEGVWAVVPGLLEVFVVVDFCVELGV
jgi:hypothetical protein